jgi:acyl dehydratase
VTRFRSIEELAGTVGGPATTSDWVLIDQERIDTFAEATGDHQWIHVDPVRAAAGPYGGTIAHGYLTLSIVPMLLFGLMTFDGDPTIINYGLDRVRFLTPVPVGSRLRAAVELTAVTPTPQGARLHQRVTVEIEGVTKPAAVAETISLLIFEQSPSI